MNKDFTDLKDDTKKDKPLSDERLVKQVKDEWDRGYEYAHEMNELYNTLYSMLRGERPEKNYDWQSNLVINKVFQVVWTTIPYMAQKIFGANPIVGVKSTDKKGSWEREEILEFWHTMQPGSKNHNPYFLVVVSWLLRSVLNGVGIMKKTWHQKLANVDGRNVPVEDWPYNIVVNNRDVVVDWLLQPGQSIRQGRFVIHREMTDLDSLRNSPIEYMNLDKIEELSAVDSELRQEHSILTSRDGQDTPPESDIYTEVEVHERVGVFPVYNEMKDNKWKACFEKQDIADGKASFKEMICSTIPDQNILIRFEPNPYDEINYIDIHLYIDPERFHSTGQVEPFKDLSTAMNDNLNAAFDEIWQNLMPPVVVNKYALWDWDTMQYAPQQKWLVGGDPSKAIKWKEPSNITQDAWQKHMLLNNEIDLTSSVTPPMQGMGKEKAATTNIMNAQMSAGKLDFLIKMVEITGLIPSAQMDVRFAIKFSHPLTLAKILGKPFRYGGQSEEIYKYVPAASTVKLEHQRSIEIQQDMQLMQAVASFNNPNAPKIMNVLWGNILRNRNMPKEAAMFDEEYFEPGGEAGNIEMMKRQIGAGATSNEQGIPMSGTEKGVREGMFSNPNRQQ